jgi:hypothetical protein
MAACQIKTTSKMCPALRLVTDIVAEFLKFKRDNKRIYLPSKHMMLEAMQQERGRLMDCRH